MKSPLKLIQLLSVLTISLTATIAAKAADAILRNTDGNWEHMKKSIKLFISLMFITNLAYANEQFLRTQDGAIQIMANSLEDKNINIGLYKVTIRNKGLIVSANLPIKEFTFCTYDYYAHLPSVASEKNNHIILNLTRGSKTVGRFNSSGPNFSTPDCQVYKLNTYKKNIEIDTANKGDWYDNEKSYAYIKSVLLHAGALDLPNDLKVPTTTTANLFQYSLEQLNSFEANMKKSDRRQITRLKKALSDALTAMMDDAGNAKLPVTHMTVQENARLIMVLATVINELLEEYSDIEAVKIQVDSLARLSKQIRDAYGWQEGLAGASSKSLVALSAVIDLELRDLVTTMSAFASDSTQVFYNLMKANHAVARAVLAKNGGDAAAKSQVQGFAVEWDAPAWQNVLAKLMDAPQDYKGLVQPKLRLLLMAVESMGDKTDVSFLIPTEGSKPAQQAVQIQKKK